jgi:hypothetical protein
MRNRIESDAVERDARQWRLDHLDPYASARPWLVGAADLVIDTSSITPSDVATELLGGYARAQSSAR